MKNLLISLLFMVQLFQTASAEELSYSGRLVNANGSPVTGLVDLKFDVAYSGAPSVIICTKTVSGVALANGVFHVSLDFENPDCASSKAFVDVLSDVPTNESVILQVTDSTNSKVYPHQALKSVPFSIQASIAKTIHTAVAPAEGQILKWISGKWTPAADGGGSGSVTEIQTGSGLSGGPITSTGTISIATNGVTSSHILDGTITNTDINTSAGIARSKIAGSLANHVVINDGAGLLSAVSHLPVNLGGTGAGTASDARNNLGLGNVATRDVGLNSGNVLLADEVPSCLAHQKIQKTALAPYIFSCADDNDSADASKLPLLGGTMLGAINMGGFAITNLVDPTNPQDAATRNYVHNYVASELLGVSESQWSDNGSNIYYSTGNVGIGTPTPARALHVVGDLRIDGITSKLIVRGDQTQPTAFISDSGENFSVLRCGDSNCTGGQNLIQSNTARTVFWQNLGLGVSSPGAKLDVNGAGVIPIQISSTANNTWQVGPNVGSASGFTIRDVTSGANRLNIDLSGNVGIGSILPGAKLEVAGQVKITGGSPGAGKVLTSDGSGLATWETPSAPTTGSINSSHIVDGSIVDADINASAAIAQSKIANLTTDLAAKQAADADLAAIAALSSYGILVRNSDNSFVTRTLMGAAGRTFVSNSNGATGNPTIDISNSLLPSPIAGDEGKFLKVSGPGVSVWSALASGDITTALGFTPVNKAGDTMTGALMLSADPTNNLHAATKQYVDSAISSSSSWTVSGSNVYRASGNVGIGTVLPSHSLHIIHGAVDLTGDIVLETFNPGIQLKDRSTSPDSGDFRIHVNRASSSVPTNMTISADVASDGVFEQDIITLTDVGNVGIGTTTPGAATKLNVEGQIRSKSFSTTTGAIDWSNGNAGTTSFDCGSTVTFANLRDGGSYTLVVTGTGTTACSFSNSTTGDDAATVNYRFLPVNGNRAASSHTVYSLQRIGSTVYVSWMTGF